MEKNMIFGSPGTGKTTRLLEILEQELKTIEPDRVAFVSFTRKGAYEGKKRLMEKFGFSDDDLPFFRTLHSLAYQQLGLKKNQILSKWHYKKFSEAIGITFSGSYNSELENNNDRFLFYDSLQRNNATASENFLYDINIKTYNYIKNNYNVFKKTLKVYDFTDILEFYIKKGLPLDIDIAVIDEAQDLTSLQWQMIEFAFSKCKKIYIAGDDDQSIYEWAGADVKYYLNYKYTGKEILTISHRLPDNVLKLSKKILQGIKNRVEKETKTTQPAGNIEYINNFKELIIDNENSWLFLSRNNYCLNRVQKYLRDRGILYKYKHTPSINQLDIAAIIHYTNVCNKKESLQPHKIYTYVDNIDRLTYDKPWFEVMNFDEDTALYYRDIAANGNMRNDFEDIKINVDTIHGSKGGEADNVVLMSDISRNVELNKEKNYDEEMRVLYVGITRTKKNLFVVNPETDYYYNELLRR